MSTRHASRRRKSRGRKLPKGLPASFDGGPEAVPSASLDHVSAIWRAVYFRELRWFKIYDDRLLFDEYFERAQFLIAYGPDRRPLGTARLVLPAGGPLPVERYCDLSQWIDRRTAIELTRIMVLPAYRKRHLPGYPFGVYRALLRAAFGFAESRRFDSVVLNVRAPGEPDSILPSLQVYGPLETGLAIRDEFDLRNPLCTPVIVNLARMKTLAATRGDPLLLYSTETMEDGYMPLPLDGSIALINPGRSPA